MLSLPSYHTAKTWLLHLTVAVCLAQLPVVYMLAAVAVFWIMMQLYQLIFHDWICHNYCEPRGGVLTAAMLLIFYTHDNNVHSKRNYHIYHHRHWQDQDRDPTYRKLEGVSLWRYWLGLQRNLDLGIPNRDVSLLEQHTWVRWMDQHSRKIYVVWVAAMAVLLPWPWFVIVCVYYPWLLHLFMCWHDYHLHGPTQQADQNWLSLAAGHCAWHKQHHLQWQQEYYGPGVWRWFSVSWYLRHLLFRQAPVV